jgi:hypothetical protein
LSWEQLRNIVKDARKDIEQQRRSAPIACPNDGTVLQKNPRTGYLQCSFDGYVYKPGEVNPT